MEFDEARVVQIPQRDVRYHPNADFYEPSCLDRLARSHLNQESFDAPMDAKFREALLWAPYLLRNEVKTIFCKSPRLSPVRQEIHDAVSLWNDAGQVDIKTSVAWPVSNGEIFFEAPLWNLCSQ